MRGTLLWFALLAAFVPSAATAAGFAHDKNFIVYAQDQALADQVLAKANCYRREVAKEWLGEELPAGIGRAIINVEISKDDTSFTWPIDGVELTLHKTWLATSRENATAGSLHHEVTHQVFATRFPAGLPAWIEEGVASHYDDAKRRDEQRDTVRWCLKSGNLPALTALVKQKKISADDQASYSVANSLVEYLLSRHDKPTLLAFTTAGQRSGWDAAVKEYYGLQNLAELETAWRAWARQASPSS